VTENENLLTVTAFLSKLLQRGWQWQQVDEKDTILLLTL